MSVDTVASRPLLARGRVADQIFEALKLQIMTGALPRGARLPTEKELGELYDVSGPTVREAIRGLSSVGLIEVRHGSGAYVTASSESLVAMSLSAVIQLETVGASDALGILGVLSVHAAASAVTQATASDLRRLRETADALVDVPDAERAAAGVRAFHHALVRAAHNPLLEMICGFLSNVQVAFAIEITGGSLASWRDILQALHEVRSRLVEAIERRDSKAAAKSAKEFNAEVVRLITSLPRAQEVRIADPQLRALLSSVVGTMSRAN